MSLRAVLLVGAVAAASAPLPPAGTTVSIKPAPRPSTTLRHCDYVCSVDADDGSQDFQFVVEAARNGKPAPYVSFHSANFPDHALSLIAGSASGAVGINVNPDADDATWLVTGPAGNYTLVSQTRAAGLAGAVLSLARTNTGPCHDGPDVVLAAPGAGGIDAQAWAVGAPPPPPPPPPTAVTVAAGAVTQTLSTSILGCQ